MEISVGEAVLFPVEAFVDCYLAVLLHGDDAMNALESRQGDVENVVAWIQVKLYRRVLIENAIVDGDLCTLWRRLDADCAHSSSIAATKELLELATNLDVVGVA